MNSEAQNPKEQPILGSDDHHSNEAGEAAILDHKQLGRELDIFAFDEEIGRGLPLWLPNGTVLRDELERFMRELEFEAGYQRVATPLLARRELYFRTGHLPYFADSMFPFMVVPESAGGSSDTGDAGQRQVYCLKPMNCPHHHKVFAARKRSYRELPLRLAEYGTCHRYEDSGAVSGLLRTRGMCMNDAHIYCSKDQVVQECLAILEMYSRVYATLGLTRWRIRLSTRGRGSEAKSKYVDDAAGWDWSEAVLRGVLQDRGLPFFEGPAEAAFYGPKIDFQFSMSTGREETASTLQLDFAMANRIDLRYVGADGAEHPPMILHRAPASTHERFVAILLERFAGAFPTWLSPVQVRVVPVGVPFFEYGRQIVTRLRAKHVRAEIDDSEDSFNKKIRTAASKKIPNVVIVGRREQTENSVTVRHRGKREQQTLPLERFEAELIDAISARTLDVG